MVCKRGATKDTLRMKGRSSTVDVVTKPHCTLLGSKLDATFTGLKALEHWKSTVSQHLPLIKEIRTHLGKQWAIYALTKKIEPKAYYGSEVAWVKDAQLQKLDGSCTVSGLKTAFAIPRRENGKAVLYEAPVPWVSTQVTLAQTRQFLRMVWGDNPHRQRLLRACFQSRVTLPYSDGKTESRKGSDYWA